MAKAQSTIRFTSFPLTLPPPPFVAPLVSAFRKHEATIGTQNRKTQLQSNDLLHIVKDDLLELGFQVELSKKADGRISRPVFFGENGEATKTYSVDAYHPQFKCGLEIEAGRAIGGNAIYRDLIQSMVMVEVEHLVLAVANVYRYGKTRTYDYQATTSIAAALYGHDRIRMPYGLTVLGY